MPSPTERLPLTGADAFLLAFDALTRRQNRASHLSQLVLRLGPGFDAEGFRGALEAVVRANPIAVAPIRRRLGLGVPEYRLDLARRAPGPRFREHRASGDGFPAVFAERLNALQDASRGGLFDVDAVRRKGGGTDLALTWQHMLLDGFGSERFVELVADVYAGKRAPDAVPEADQPGAPPFVELPASQRERGLLAMSWQRWMSELGRKGVRSLTGPERGARQDLVVERVRFDADESRRIQERAVALAGFLTPMIFYLAASVRAHHAVLAHRGEAPESYVVPLPVNLRPKGREGAIFRTHVSLLWFQVDAAIVGDFEALLAALKEQRRRAIRSGMIEAGVAAMDYAKSAPSRLYGQMARRNLKGELCSFLFAYTGEFCAGLDSFCGAPVEDGFGVPSVPASPGSALILALQGGRLGTTHVRQRDAFRPGELERFSEQLGRDLLG